MRIALCPDLHAPFHHPAFLDFFTDIVNAQKCNKIIHLGDFYSCEYASSHPKSPSLPSAVEEIDLGRIEAQRWYKRFPIMDVLLSNHERRVANRMADGGIPACVARSFNELYGTPKWKWTDDDIFIDNFTATHGEQAGGGKFPGESLMRKLLSSVVCAHTHTAFNLVWAANARARFFAASAGCGIDEQSVAFAYSRKTRPKAILGCVTVIDGMPQLHMMAMAKGEKYNRSRFK